MIIPDNITPPDISITIMIMFLLLSILPASHQACTSNPMR
jgi:hypothetical protein